MNPRSFSPVNILLFIALMLSGLSSGQPVQARQADVPEPPLRPIVVQAEHFDLSPALRDLTPVSAEAHSAAQLQTTLPLPKALNSSASIAEDAALQTTQGATAMPAPLTSFDGVGNVNGVLPPDTQGDIGYDPVTGAKYYVQWVNLSFAVWDVTNLPTQVYGPVSGNTLWQGFGGPCETTNHGDPITLFDTQAQRWLMSQFSVNGPYYQCIAISQTADPLGPWYRYGFLVSNNKMNDYPHFGVWPDGYYMTVNQFTNASSWGGAGVFVFDRERMLAGQNATFQYFDLYSVNSSFGGMLPSDMDGQNPPPAGAPNYFMEVDDSSWIGPDDAIRLWEFHVDWDNPANTSFGLNGQPNVVLPVDGWTPLCTSTRSCVPQPDTTQRLDAIADRLMYRLAYRNFGDHESLVLNHTVNAGSGKAGVRWYEVRDPGGTPLVYQQGTYAPDSDNRWMGSVSMDASGNLAVGYSVSSSTTYPSIRYAGRLANDPLGQLPQAEASLVSGGGSQTHSAARWGDYSMLTTDPVDDCTFWFTTEYMASTSSAGWKTRIGSFRFEDCGADPPGGLKGKVRQAGTNQPLPGAIVSAFSDPETGFQTTTNASGDYSLLLPPAIYTVTASAYGFLPQTFTGIDVQSQVTGTLNVTLAAADYFNVSGQVVDAQTGWPLYAHIQISGDPVSPPEGELWTDPQTGEFSLSLASGVQYTFDVQAWTPGYQPVQVTFGSLAGDEYHEIPLAVDPVTCTAPGYGRNAYGLSETFDNGTLPSGWSVIDNAGTGVVWRFDNPGGRSNYTGGDGLFAIIDSDDAGPGGVNTELRVPAQDFSGFDLPILEFKYDFRWYSEGLDEVADVDVSTNGGASWTNVWRRTDISDRGPKTATVDLAPYAGGSNVQVRFRYYSANFEWWWQVDDVFLGEQSCEPQAGGLVVGQTSDGNTGAPLSGALLQNDAGFSTETRHGLNPALEGDFYTLFSPAGARIITATVAGYGPQVASLDVLDGAVSRQDFALPAGWLHSNPTGASLTLMPGETGSLSLDLENWGLLDASFQVEEVNAPLAALEPTGPFAPATRRTSPKGLQDTDASAVRSYQPPLAPPLPFGQELQRWSSGLTGLWGLAYDSAADRLWLGSIGLVKGDDRAHAYSVQGASQGAELQAETFVSVFGADMAYDPLTGLVWQVNVGGDNCIYALDPQTGAASGDKICPGFGMPQRGLAYDPATDSFYSGSWGDQIVHHFDRQGRLLASIDTRLNVSGLAFNPANGHLLVASNARIGFDVYVLDTRRGFANLGGFDLPGMGDFEIASLDLDCSGAVWATNQATGDVLQATSGEVGVCAWADVPWLSVSPASGSVAANGATGLTLDFNTTGLTGGVYPAHLQVVNNTPYGLVSIPVTLTVPTAYSPMIAPQDGMHNGDPGQDAVYTFDVTNGGQQSDTFDVELSGGTWAAQAPATVGPLNFGVGAQLPVTVTVPVEATCGDSDTLQVRILSQGDPNLSSSALLTTYANPRYDLALDAAQQDISGLPGSVVSYTLQLTNAGNCSDSFNLEFGSDWTVQAPAEVGPLAAGEVATITVGVVIPDNAYSGESRLTPVTITSQGNPAMQTTVDLTTTARNQLDVAFYGDSGPIHGQGAPGETITYVVMVLNTGLTTDSYDLSLSAATGDWTARLSTAELIDLGPEEGAALQVEVDIPAQSAVGEQFELILNAVSRSDATVSAEIVLVTEVQLHGVYLPLLRR